MTRSIFEAELTTLNPRQLDGRQDVLNSAEFLAVDIGARAGRVANIINGQRQTGIPELDRLINTVDATGILRQNQNLEAFDIRLSHVANISVRTGVEQARVRTH